jgi:hypothetical protein
MLLGIKQRTEQIGVSAVEPVTTKAEEKTQKNGTVASPLKV